MSQREGSCGNKKKLQGLGLVGERGFLGGVCGFLGEWPR